MLTCPRCGTSVPQDVYVCSRCGLTRDLGPTRIRPAVGAAPDERTPPTRFAPRRPPPPLTPTPPLPHRPRTGLAVAGVVGLALVVAVVGSAVWLVGSDDAPAAGGGDDPVPLLVENGEVGRLPQPVAGPPEEAWTWVPSAKVADVTADADGVVVSETDGDPFDDPARVTRVDPEGEEAWVVQFAEAATYEAQLNDDLVLGTTATDRSLVEVASIADGRSVWVAEGEYLGRGEGLVVVQRQDGPDALDVVALDGASGEELSTVEDVSSASAYGGTPVTVTPDGTVRLHEAGTGEVRWEVESPVEPVVPGSDDLLGGATRTVVLAGDQVVVVGADGSAGLDTEDGGILWTSARVRGGEATSVVPMLGDRAIVLGSVDGGGPGRAPVVLDGGGYVGRLLVEPSLATAVASWDVDGRALTNVDTLVVDDDLAAVGRRHPVVLPVDGGFYSARPGRVELVDPSSPDEPVWAAEIPGLLGPDTALGTSDGLLVSSRNGRLTGYR